MREGMRNLQILDSVEPTGPGREGDGAALFGELRTRKAVGVPAGARELPGARTGGRADAAKAGGVAGKEVKPKKKRQTRLSHVTFAMVLEELLSGATTCKTIAEHSGLSHRYVCQLFRTFHARKVVHIAGWEKDSLGRIAVVAYGLGPGKDAKRPSKPRQQVNREYRVRRDRSQLAGTPFYGLGA